MSAELDRARILIDLNRFEAAREELARALAATPDDADALTLLAVASLGLRDRREAVAQSTAALRADPESQWALRVLALSSFGLAESLRATDRVQWRTLREQARDAARQATQLGPHEPQNHRVLAIVLESGDRDAAVRALTRAIELAPENAALHVLHAGILRRTPGDTTKQSEAAAREALRIDPENIDALEELALNDMISGRVRPARRNLLRVAELDPSRGDSVRARLATLRSGVVFRIAAKLLRRSRTWPDRPVRPPRPLPRRRTLFAVTVGGYFTIRLLLYAAGCSPDSAPEAPVPPPTFMPTFDPWPTLDSPRFTLPPELAPPSAHS
ncbi:tetratricopeptide repeat protein [Nocardia sp. NBC_01327]|uniref:tetratricopeptide repeat protein n=1 Tax=Nocardia sp. NBC_01327 TaxID=2903593 RepID=UPI002E143011|nr:tetratricopeptide repeat protein [Nocardia sp. NBC_01327]